MKILSYDYGTVGILHSNSLFQKKLLDFYRTFVKKANLDI